MSDAITLAAASGARVKNGQELNKAMQKIWKGFENEAGAIMREATTNMRSQASLLTPKDTGWASRHWSIGLNATHENEEVSVDPMESLKFGDVTHVFNNVPYIKRLDEGWSMQKPAGFTHLVLAFISASLTAKLHSLSQKKVP